MAFCTSRATISFSIDLELEIGTRSAWLEERLSRSSSKLLALLDRFNIAATWGVADPALSAAAEEILASKVPHQLAVLADRSWLGRSYPLAWQSAELGRRFSRARQAGLHPRTLALHNVSDAPAISLLQEHQIDALRLPARFDWRTAPQDSFASPQQAALTIVPALAIPPRTSWWLPAKWNAQRHLTHALKAGNFLHLTIDGQQLAAQGDLLLRQLEVWFQQLTQLQLQDRVQVQTLEEWLTNAARLEKLVSPLSLREKAGSISAAA